MLSPPTRREGRALVAETGHRIPSSTATTAALLDPLIPGEPLSEYHVMLLNRPQLATALLDKDRSQAPAGWKRPAAPLVARLPHR